MSFWHNPLIDRQFRLNQSTNSHWNLYDSHRQSVQDLITSVPHISSARLCVLGAGNCNDLDLNRLIRYFSEIHLVDLDSKALERGVSQQKLIKHKKIKLHGGIDVTGIFPTLKSWSASKKTSTFLHHCIRQALNFTGLPFLGSFEITISTCLLTQIIDSIVFISSLKHPPMELLQALRIRHLRLLAELLVPDGVGLIVTDFSYVKENNQIATDSRSFLGVSPEDLYSLTVTDNVLSSMVQKSRIISPWLWRLNPKCTLKVGAVQFHRNPYSSKILSV